MFALLCTTLLAGHGFTAVFGGDIMLNGIPVGRKSLAAMKPAFTSGAVAFANLEIPLTDARVATNRKSPAELKAKHQFILKADPLHGPEVKDAGIDLVSLGNNHAMDYRLPGLQQMTQQLDKLGIRHTGADGNRGLASRVTVYRLPDGTRVGLLSSLAFESTAGAWHTTAATDTSPGVMYLHFHATVDENARAFLRDWIAQARKDCDFLVVAYHWGIERTSVPTRYQVALARATIEAGADTVWGHHPHVLQGAEVYKGKAILYSMGNLVSPLPSSTGLVRIYFQDGNVHKARFLPAQVSAGRVRPVGGAGAMHNLCRLLARRFPSRDSKPMF